MCKSLVVFAPHPDDETLGCGAIISRKIGEGYDVFVAVMTDGRHSHNHVLGITDPPPVTIKMTRRGEFHQAMEILGVKKSNTQMLDFEDGELGEHFEEALERSSSILSRVRPVEVYVTYRADKKRDHENAFKIVNQSLTQLGIAATIYEYPIWSRKKAPAEYSKQGTFILEVANQLAVKRAAIGKYRSQTSRFFERQKEPILSGIANAQV